MTLAKCCDRKNIIPSVLCLSDGLLISKLEESGIAAFLIPMTSKRDIILPLLKTIKLIKKENIDIIHTHTVRSNLIGRLAAFFSRRKCITHLHSPILRDFADLKRGRINEIVDSLTRPFADRYIAVSHSLREEMVQRGMSGQKIVTVHNALDLESLYVSDKKKDISETSIRAEYNIPETNFLITLVALLRPRKGVEVLIKAMKKVCTHFPEVSLLIVGNDDISEDPGYAQRLRSTVSDLGMEKNIFFTGFRDNVPEILTESNLMALPSLFGEGLPMVILESMAMGLPVVASKLEGIPEVIDDDVTGFLVNPNDVEALSDKIIKIMESPDLVETVVKNARKKITTEMNGYRQASQVEAIYKDVLSHNKFSSNSLT